MSESWEGRAWWLSESGQAIHVGWTNELIVEKYNLTIVQLLMKLKILGATCQSNTATWRQDQGSTYHPRFQISIFCLNTFFFFFTKPYTVLKMTCRQNSTDLWKANHKLCSNTHFSASETHFTWSRNSDFLLKITSGTKDYKAYFPKANVPPTIYRTLEKMLRMKQRGKPWMLKCRGEERRPLRRVF